MPKHWDIFCKIVDNFGDIGVCWRLAKQLQAEHGLQVRLWVDDLASAQKIIPNFSHKDQQLIDGVNVVCWLADHAFDAAYFTEAAEVVIEAFACDLPPNYLASMAQKQSAWVNLEYLSAEKWVDDFHAQPSPQAGGLARYFYFPGFTQKTGGLIRELAFISNQNSTWIPAFAGMTEDKISQGALNISLFCYPHAPIQDLLNALQANIHAVHMFVPATSILPQIAQFFGKASAQIGETLRRANLTVKVLPFLSQDEYDQLLRSCDLNFVRGEDSWVRAIWAGKPFIWQPYWQAENTHIKKLKAFIDLYYADCEQKEVLWKAHEYWAAEHAPRSDTHTIWKNYVDALAELQIYSVARAKQQAEQTDLATQLVNFCEKLCDELYS